MGAAGGFGLGRIAGIEVRVDLSLIVVFLLVATSLAGGLFPAWHRDWSRALAWAVALAAAVLFFASVLLHELSHALMGRVVGVEIRRITLFMFGGMAHMEGEPRSWRAEFAMAIVGPLTSLALGIGCTFLARLVAGPFPLDPERPHEAFAALGPVPTLLLWLGPINVMLAVFNLIPGYPLDGGRVLRALAWAVTGSLRRATRIASRAGQAFGFLLVAMGVGMALGLRVPFFGTGLLSGLWLVFIGWFLNNAAVAGYRQLLVHDALEDVPVSRLMQTHLTRVPPEMRVGTLVDDVMMRSGQRAFPVEADGRFVGLVVMRDLHGPGRRAWDETAVAQVMRPAADLATVTPGTSGAEALAVLGRRQVNQLPVLEDGRLVGLLRREDVIQWLSLHPEPQETEAPRERGSRA